jgi:phage tail protein X
MRDLWEDIKSAEWMTFKIIDSINYAQNLYAACCNNTFKTADESTIDWCCSWRFAARMVAEIRKEGDYLDWYCSGMFEKKSGHVSESTITEEIAADLARAGWLAVKEEEME